MADSVLVPKGTSKSHVQPRQKGAISPPPLKRQRTTYDKFSSETREPRSTNRQAHLPTSSDALRHSFSGDVEIASTTPSKRKPDIIPVSKSFPAPSAPHRHDNRNVHHTSGSRLAPRPRQPSKPASLSKPACRMCEKSSATSFNPIVSCSGCSRFFHDSCRKPPLAPGIDPQCWRCSLCLNAGGTRKNVSLSSALASTNHSVVRDIFKPRYAQPAPEFTSSNRLSKKNSDTRVKPEPARLTTNATIADNLIKPKEASGPPQPPAPKSLKRTEIPNTPSQGSSQIEGSKPEKPSGHLCEDHVSQQSHHTQDDEIVLPLEASAHVPMPAPSTTLGSTCQKQDVLAKSAEKGVECSSCRISTRFAETGRLEIPETPNVDSSRKPPLLPTSSASSTAHLSAPTVDDPGSNMASSTQDLDMSEVKPDSTVVKESPMSWFDPRRVKVLPQIRKVRDDELSCISTANIQATDTATTSHETLLGQSAPMAVDSAADINEQKAALKAKQTLRRNPVCDIAAVLQVDTQRENCVPLTENSNHDEPSRISEPHGTHSVSPSKSDMLGESEPPEPIKLSTDILPKQSPTERMTDRVVPISSAQEQAPKDLESKGTTGSIRSPSDPNVSMNPTPASTNLPDLSKRLNNRDLTRIALVCAKGTGLTALQVIDWLASRFSHLQKGQGAWEKSIKSVLSVLPEIRGMKASPESRVLYSFVSAALREKNKKRYQSYLPPDLVPGLQGGSPKARKSVRQQHGVDAIRQQEHVQNGPPTQIKRNVTKAIKSAPSRRNTTTHGSLPTPTVAEQTLPHKPFSAPVTEIDTSAPSSDGKKMPSTLSSPSISRPNVQDADPSQAKVISEDDATFNPFERTTVPRSNIMHSINIETKREKSLRSVYPRTVAPTLETMTSEEKAAKIAEIKIRPKRKQFFGSVYRLAHVRRYGRQDIHDESDGAWKPNSTTERSMGKQTSTMNDCDENQSLLEIFNLPSNAIPMSDGKELAFRDGTLINGRLPRSRQIYRVGKVFGGELTVT